MANAIKDVLTLELAAEIIKPNEKWTSEHHALLLWKYFRKQGFLANAKPEEVKKAGAEFVAWHNNARVAYASNQAKGLADAGICLANTQAAVTMEFA